jgi:hypothetical protein
MAAANMRVAERNHAQRLGEVYMRFALWCASLRRLPTWSEVADHWQVSRPTAYRWLESYRAAAGDEAGAA